MPKMDFLWFSNFTDFRTFITPGYDSDVEKDPRSYQPTSTTSSKSKSSLLSKQSWDFDLKPANRYWLTTLSWDTLFLERKLKMKKKMQISRGNSDSIGKFNYNLNVERGLYLMSSQGTCPSLVFVSAYTSTLKRENRR